MLNYLKNVLENMPDGWLSTTTHRLDIYDEKLAKTEFLDQFKLLCNKNIASFERISESLQSLTTYISFIKFSVVRKLWIKCGFNCPSPFVTNFVTSRSYVDESKLVALKSKVL